MEIDRKSGAGYYRVSHSRARVAYSVEIDDMVIADYDESGSVLGIEFVDASKHLMDAEKYVKLANQKSKGPHKIPQKISRVG